MAKKSKYAATKQWWASKTLIVAVVNFAVVLASEVFADPTIAESVKHATAYALPLIMMLLRAVTKQPISQGV